MNQFTRIFLLFFVGLTLHFSGYAQQKPSTKINDIFFQYVSKTLELKPAEEAQMRPLVRSYLYRRKKIGSSTSDPLEREQQILTLKIDVRKKMAAVVGLEKANAFFSSEQTFRKKVREELKQRYSKSKKD